MRGMILWVLLLAPACSAGIDETNQPSNVEPSCEVPCRMLGLCVDNGMCECSSPTTCTLGLYKTDTASCCMALSDYDCQHSFDCGVRGYCTQRDGRCVAGSDADCAGSADCASLGYCFACASGHCGGEDVCGGSL